MNHFAAYTKPVPGGHWAMCRFAQNAQPWPILEGDKPKVFPVQTEALIAAQGHVIKHINGTMRRDGETIKAVSDADAHFKLKPFVKAKGSNKRTIVEKVGRKGKEISVERREMA
ncbi:hypothetical protein J5288_08590 [Agrobacterium sp. S2/73]|uniref:hypothetical protein n=1 Tax=unclassified Agrobacterium TaxID=2632611 RepID=UPI001AD9E33D|nr:MULTISPECIES: hypothetical protein [unclassified Agrobacterium]MBO9108759.1 hypothetical protein [Agrobacterium sp. S2/73]QXZ73484.1 hypothetical protein J5276_05920 [Agrobacterium sp. S7/73]